MADQILTQKELEETFYDITFNMMKDHEGEEPKPGDIRNAWQQQGSPGWAINKDVVFIRITPIDNRMARQFDTAYDDSNKYKIHLQKSVGYTRVHQVNWTFYGPNAFDRADIVRVQLFDEKQKLKLRGNNLFIVTDVSMPIRVPELLNKQWWNRVDFSATFNEAVIRKSKIPYLDFKEISFIKERESYEYMKDKNGNIVKDYTGKRDKTEIKHVLNDKGEFIPKVTEGEW